MDRNKAIRATVLLNVQSELDGLAKVMKFKNYPTKLFMEVADKGNSLGTSEVRRAAISEAATQRLWASIQSEMDKIDKEIEEL